MSEISKEYIFRKYYKQFCHYAWQITKDAILAEDIVQDAFVSYFDQEEKIYDQETAIKNFLYTAIRFTALKKIRKEQTVERYWLKNKFEEASDTQIEVDIIRSEVITHIFETMKYMPNSCKEIFRLGYLEGFTNLEIAEMENISVNTVKTQKQRALKILKTKLNPEFFMLFLLLFQDVDFF